MSVESISNAVFVVLFGFVLVMAVVSAVAVWKHNTATKSKPAKSLEDEIAETVEQRVRRGL